VIGQVLDPADLGSTIDAQSLTVGDFIAAVVVVAVSFLLAVVVRRLSRRLLRRFEGLPEAYVLLMARATGWLVIVVGIIYALSVLGVDVGPAVISLLLVAGIAFFAGRGLLENFGAGLVLQGTKMFEVGDQIETTAGSGTVREITGRTVILEAFDGKEINVPNSIVVNQAVTNVTKGGRRRSEIMVGVAYGSDLVEARRVIREAATGSELTLVAPEPEALITGFDDDSINIECRFWHDPTIRGEKIAIDQVALAIEAGLADRGIEIAFPQRTLWWGAGEQPTDPGGGDGR